MVFVEAADLNELKDKKRIVIEVSGRKIILFYLHGDIFAVDAECPHRGGALDEGDFHDEEITCPLHCFMFNVKSGMCLNFPNYKAKTYAVERDGERIKVEI